LEIWFTSNFLLILNTVALGSAVVLPQILRLIRENDMIIMIPLRRP
jgi:hypothetical protein